MGNALDLSINCIVPFLMILPFKTHTLDSSIKFDVWDTALCVDVTVSRVNVSRMVTFSKNVLPKAKAVRQIMPLFAWEEN